MHRSASIPRRFTLSLSTVLVLAACGADPTPPRLADLDLGEQLEAIRQQYDLPALAAVVAEGSVIKEMAAVGVRAVGSDEPVTILDEWHLGSITKSMTATIAGVAVERGDIDWSTTIGEVFPDLVSSIRPEYVDVRLDQLLSHTSGMHNNLETASWTSLFDSPDPLPQQRRAWIVELLQEAPATTVGSFLYSNPGYVVAGTMLEEVTGQPWETLIQEDLFDPLGMTGAGFGPPGTSGAVDQPHGHTYESGTGALVPVDPADSPLPPAIAPAGEVHATLADMVAYAYAHLAGAQGEDGVVSAETFTKLHTIVASEYALGWYVAQGSWSNGVILNHGGSNRQWYAFLAVAPGVDAVHFVVTNAADGRDVSGAVGEVLNLLVAKSLS